MSTTTGHMVIFYLLSALCFIVYGFIFFKFFQKLFHLFKLLICRLNTVETLEFYVNDVTRKTNGYIVSLISTNKKYKYKIKVKVPVDYMIGESAGLYTVYSCKSPIYHYEITKGGVELNRKELIIKDLVWIFIGLALFMYFLVMSLINSMLRL